MDVENDNPPELESREPTVEDLVGLCRELNRNRVRYLIIGGFAMRGVGYIRGTMDIDLLVDASLENEARLHEALRSLPDRAIDQLEPGELQKYLVVRVADEIVVDLMKSANGIDYETAKNERIIKSIQDVEIPFASPKLLWRMKYRTHREKDGPDVLFLRHYFESRGESPPC